MRQSSTGNALARQRSLLGTLHRARLQIAYSGQAINGHKRTVARLPIIRQGFLCYAMPCYQLESTCPSSKPLAKTATRRGNRRRQNESFSMRTDTRPVRASLHHILWSAKDIRKCCRVSEIKAVHLVEVGQCEATGLVYLTEHDVMILAVKCAPVATTPLQCAAHVAREVGMAPKYLVQHRHRPDAGSGLQQRNDLGVKIRPRDLDVGVSRGAFFCDGSRGTEPGACACLGLSRFLTCFECPVEACTVRARCDVFVTDAASVNPPRPSSPTPPARTRWATPVAPVVALTPLIYRETQGTPRAAHPLQPRSYSIASIL